MSGQRQPRMNDDLKALRDRLGTVSDLSSAANVLSWDQETYMPDGATAARAQQLATLRRLAHELFTAEETAVLLDRLSGTAGQSDDTTPEGALVRVTRRDFERERRIPSNLVAALAQESALAQQAWKKARHSNAHGSFASHLERLLDLTVQKAEAIGFDEHPYDALLDEYEPGMRTREVKAVFGDLRERLVPLVSQIAEGSQVDDGFLHRPYERSTQWEFGLAVLRDVGYDFERGRQDVSAHPFTTSFAISDVRITTRLDENFFPAGFFASLHEAGHALYEQGIDPEFDRTPLADGTSLGIHESQSRLWENMVGRSRPFWDHYFPRLRTVFPDALSDVDVEDFYRALNRVEPSLIRVEADEVTYNLHIMLRFEIELLLIEGGVSVPELPDVWNAKMEECMGLLPDSDAHGVLQDVHWSFAAFGYFPTYTLGNLMSAQLFNQAQHDVPNLTAQIAGGRFEELLRWLRRNVHRHGRARSAHEIMESTTGSTLSAEPWLAYVREKWGEIYDF